MSKLKKFIKRFIGWDHSPFLLVYHFLQAFLANVYYWFPTKWKLVVWITWTDGKTTCITLLWEILEKVWYKVWLASTVHFWDWKNKFTNKSKKTSLSPWELNKFLKEIKQNNVDIILIEVSSHSLDQNRVWWIRFKFWLITNLTREHLDYHETMENYAKSKAKLIKIIQKNWWKIVLNHDNEWFNFFHNIATNSWIYFSKYNENHYLYTEKIDKNNFVLKSNEFEDLNEKTFYTDLLWDYNLENILWIILLAKLLDIKFKDIYEWIKDFAWVPWRLETFWHKWKPKVLVDYAVTPDSLEKLYSNIKENFKYNNLIAVLWSCGDRDKWKRPLMWKVVDSYTDYIVLTNEDPYTEDPYKIICDIERWLLTKNLCDENHHPVPSQSYFKILDRKNAIDFAINNLGKEWDLIVITWKWAETWMMIWTDILPFNERKIVKNCLKKRHIEE